MPVETYQIVLCLAESFQQLQSGITIIDPSTGYPADTGLLSVTVVSENAALADALSTSCFVLGPEEALELWRTGGGLDAFELVLCRTDGTVVVTEGLEEGLTFHGEEGGYVCETARR